MVTNEGVAFGIPISGWWWQVLMLGLVIYVWQKEARWWSGSMLVFVGGVLNLYERVVFGRVVDTMAIPLINLWINWADILITLGCLIYIIKLIRHNKIGPSLRKGTDL